MPKAWLGELGARLPQIALAMLAAKRGGPEASAAFMGGLQQSADRRQALTRQAQLDEERRGAQAQQDARQDRQMALQEQTLASQEARASVDDTRMAAADKQRRLSEALAYLDKYSQQMGATANDPVAAENAMLSRASMLEGPMGLPQGQLSPFIQPMAPVISARNKKEAEAIYARAEKMYGSEALANDSITLQTGELFGDVKPSQLRALFAPPAMDAMGQAVRPAVAASDEAITGTSEHAGRYRILRDEFVSNSGIQPNSSERRALDDQARKDTTTPVDPEIAALRKDILRDQASRSGTGADPGPLETIIGPDGKPIRVRRQDAIGKPPASGTEKASSGLQKRALNFFNRAQQADGELETLEPQIQQLSLASQGRMQYAPNFAQTQLGQSYIAAQRAFTEARLRKDSGAAIPPQEFANDRQTYFAQPGDSQTTLEQKRRARAAMLASLGFESGQALGEYLGDADEARAVVEGYKARSARPISTETAPVGTKRTFPNGRTGTWDGKGWKAE